MLLVGSAGGKSPEELGIEQTPSAVPARESL
jgi:hypothetical protein